MALTKISSAGIQTSPSFSGSSTFTGNVNITGVTTFADDLIISSSLPRITLNDTNHESDFDIKNENGSFRIRDLDNPTDRYRINSSGTIHEFFGTADFNSHLTVDGNLYIADSIIHSGDTDTLIRFHDADKFRIELGGVTPAFSGLKSTSGAAHAKWGINVATPQAALHIDEAYNHQGVLRITNGNQGTGYYHQLEMSGTQNIFTLWKHYDGSSTKTTHIHGSTRHAWYIGGNEKVRVHSDGNVGIGSAAPAALLNLMSTNPLIRLTDSDNSAYSTIGGESGN